MLLVLPCSAASVCSENQSTLKQLSRDFPGDPVAKTLCFQCKGSGFDPQSGKEIPHEATKRSWMPKLRPRAAKERKKRKERCSPLQGFPNCHHQGRLCSGASLEPHSNSIPSQIQHGFHRITGARIPRKMVGKKQDLQVVPKLPQSRQIKAGEPHSHFFRRQTEAGASSTVLRTYQECLGVSCFCAHMDYWCCNHSPWHTSLPVPNNISKWPGEGRKMKDHWAITTRHTVPYIPHGQQPGVLSA